VADTRDELDPEPAAPELYRIPMLPVEAEVLLLGHSRARVTLHLTTQSSRHSGPETVDEFLNSPRRFIPAHERSTGRAMLLNREVLAWVCVGRDAPMERDREAHVAAMMDMVRVELVDGSELEGTLRDVSAAPSDRLSDVFNHPDQFFPLEAEERVTYVNKRQVAVVRL